jgi:hypothetical protein
MSSVQDKISEINRIANNTELAYNNMKSSNTYQSNNDSSKIIVNSANNTISQLNNINVGLLSNTNQEILAKKDEFIKLQNKDLTNQLRNLESIESNIENKNVIIDQINYNMKVQQDNIKILIVSIIFAIILLSIIFAYGYNFIEYSMFIYIIIYLIIVYVFFIIYQYDIFYVKSALSAIFNRNLPNRIDNSVKDIQNYVINQLEEDIYGVKSEWIEENCKCPEEETIPEPIINLDSNIFQEDSGLYYYDASSPPQLLLSNPQAPDYTPISALPKRSSLGNVDERINWVDYDTVQDMYSKNYYNYNNTDSSNILKNELNSSNIYVASETWTNNL